MSGRRWEKRWERDILGAMERFCRAAPRPTISAATRTQRAPWLSFLIPFPFLSHSFSTGHPPSTTRTIHRRFPPPGKGSPSSQEGFGRIFTHAEVAGGPRRRRARDRPPSDSARPPPALAACPAPSIPQPRTVQKSKHVITSPRLRCPCSCSMSSRRGSSSLLLNSRHWPDCGNKSLWSWLRQELSTDAAHRLHYRPDGLVDPARRCCTHVVRAR